MTRSFTEIKDTWLTRKPHEDSRFIAVVMTSLLLLGSLLGWSLWGEALKASGETVFAHREFYRLWTTIFVHGDAAHLLSNSFLFFILGFFLYGHFGLQMFPFAALFWGGVANAIVLKTYDPAIGLIGASGVVYWMGGAWLALYFFLSRQKTTWQRWLRSTGVALMIFAPSVTLQSNVSHRTHFAGFALGLVFGILYYVFHRQKFLASERSVTTIERDESGDELPGPNGFPADSLAHDGIWPESSALAGIRRDGEGIALGLTSAFVHLREAHTIDGWPDADLLPLEIESAELELETGPLAIPWQAPTQYEGAVKLNLCFRDREAPLLIEGRGLSIS